MFKLTILGSGSALPSVRRGASSQVLSVNGKLYLIDCGEGTQLRLRQARIKMQSIDVICISHLHGDHYFGLIGLLSSMHLLGRTKDIDIYAPTALKAILTAQFRASATDLRFNFIFHELSQKSKHLLFEDKNLEVSAFTLKHGIPCWGFIFQEKPKKPNIRKEFIQAFEPDIEEIAIIKRGGDYKTKDGNIIPQSEICTPAQPPRSYAYCSDTKYDETLVPHIHGATLLYHEASFANDLKHEAANRYHSTAEQAATIAKMANVKQLLIGHFSARYKDLTVLHEEAKAVFENTVVAEDGKEIEL